MRPQHAIGKHSRQNTAAPYLVLLLLTAVTVATVMLVVWIWSPVERPAQHADAVVVLAYGEDRLKLGRELVEQGVADDLVISVSEGTQRRIAEGVLPVLGPEQLDEDPEAQSRWIEECGADFGTYVTHCVYPLPDSTDGEALAVQTLMEQNGWDSIVIVTERSHMNRALYTFERCTSGQVHTAVTNRAGPWHRDVRRTLHELGAWGKFFVLPSC